MMATVPTLTPQQVEFIASDQLTEILPLVPMDEIALMCGTFGPLQPQVPASVPLWLAIHLKKRSHCRMRPPVWLTKATLEALLKTERDLGDDAFAALPSPHFVELSMLMLEHAREAIADSERVRQLVEQICDTRRAKVMSGLATLAGPTVLVKLNNLTVSEINLLRPFMAPAMQQFDKIAAASSSSSANQ